MTENKNNNEDESDKFTEIYSSEKRTDLTKIETMDDIVNALATGPWNIFAWITISSGELHWILHKIL